jgi:restriction system protein
MLARIEDGEPATWQDLEISVARILSEAGLNTERNKVLETVRGSVAIDVYAEDHTTAPSNVMLVECKHWRNAVPQSVVHGFRTTVNDSGANVGLIVSTSGFQSGTAGAAHLSNVHLVDWEVFQGLFADRWHRNYFVKQGFQALDPLHEYTEPITSRIFRKADALPRHVQTEFGRLRDKHRGLATLLLVYFFPGASAAGLEHGMPVLPLVQRIASGMLPETGLPPEILNAASLRGFLAAVTGCAAAAVSEFDELFGERA